MSRNHERDVNVCWRWRRFLIPISCEPQLPSDLGAMKGRMIPLLVGSMTIAMMVVVAVQVSWLESSAKLRKEVFDQSVEQSWNRAARRTRIAEKP